ncbi:MAG: acetyl-CoA carboxylase biotin carboxyl carrier protein [Planctomycetota bacterium]
MSPKKAPAPRVLGKNAKRAGGSGERLQKLQELIQLMAAQDVVEVELEEAGTRWRVRRKEDRGSPGYAPAPMPPSVPPENRTASPAIEVPPVEPEGEVFKSPMLGTFYRAPSPEAEPFVKPGDRVGQDTTLCIIEAMKVMNEIKAEREFQVLEVLVRNGDPVEYGQPMFLIKA